MRYLLEDMRKAWKDGLLVLLVWVAAMAVACTFKAGRGAGEPEPIVAPTSYLMGGPGWRVMDVRESSPAGNKLIEQWGRELAACIGEDPEPLDDYTWYGANVIQYRTTSLDGRWQWRLANGLTLYEEEWVYVRAGRPLDQIEGTVKHEAIHILTRLDHPEADSLIGACAGQLRYQ